MRVLGIDPGSRHTGWGVVDCHGATARAVAWGRLSARAELELADRLRVIAEALEAVAREHGADLAALERVFHGANTRSLIVLAEARGALLVAIARVGIPLLELSPASVKSSVAGHGAADKQQVARMVKLQLGLGAVALPSDASDALALALAAGQSAVAQRLGMR